MTDILNPHQSLITKIKSLNIQIELFFIFILDFLIFYRCDMNYTAKNRMIY